MTQKSLAAKIFKCSPKRVRLLASPEELKNAIRKQDIRNLISKGKIVSIQKQTPSRGRARKRHSQQKKGRQQGPGNKTGTKKTRSKEKKQWMQTIRLQRQELALLKNQKKLTAQKYREMYAKARGGFFRSKKHLTSYIEEQK